MYRDNTKVIQIGNRKIGGGNPILIQSMTNTKTEDCLLYTSHDKFKSCIYCGKSVKRSH